MNTLATTMIRLDHTQVTALYQQYSPDAPSPLKQALSNTICIALEVHTQLEDELFYPALREAGVDTEVVDKSVPEHDAIRQRMAELRAMRADEPAFDELFAALMRDVLHHVADEETTLLPDAERLIPDRLGEIGARMSWRRMELSMPYALELTANAVQAATATPMLLAGAFIAQHSAQGPLRPL